MKTIEKLKRLLSTPRYVTAMQRVYRAADEQDWPGVAEMLEQLHDQGLATNMSRHWLGMTYLKLGRCRDALGQYESIEGRLRANDSEARRLLNHAVSHYRLGDPQRCANMLKEAINSSWPAVELHAAKALLSEIDAEH